MRMTPQTPLLDDAWVSLDLETTGLDPDRDSIIEVGAVKFRGAEVLDTFQSFVNPYRPVPEFVHRLTGITQREVDRAPPFTVVNDQFSHFVGSLPIVGHNIPFDLAFLSKHGLTLNNEAYDTWDLAATILPRSTEYALARLAKHLGLVHPRPHRALPDAQATHAVFLALLEKARDLDTGVVNYIQLLASRARWPTGTLLRRVSQGEERAGVGPGGLDPDSISSRLGHRGSLRPSREKVDVDEEELAGILAPDGLLSHQFPGFEHRPQQIEMLRAVVRAFNQGGHLIAEAGTGVGKSLAYLLPALLFAVKNGTRVVISTNTINLQEQLLQKDIPALVKVLEEAGLVAPGELRAAPLKGRANYLCLRQWSQMARSDSLSTDEARLLSKTLVWVQDTASGDRAEINLAGRDSLLWSRVSASEKVACPGMRGEGPCFLKASREQAEAAHLVVVNHALLLSDLAMGGSLLPDYHYLIVDEAHHLEEEATRQLGFQVSQGGLAERLETLERLITEGRVVLRAYATAQGQAALGEQRIASIEGYMPRIRETWAGLWSSAERFLRHHSKAGDDRPQVSLDRTARVQPAWSELEIAWENVDVSLAEAVSLVDALITFLSGLPSEGPLDSETVALGLHTWQAEIEELRQRLSTLMSAPLQERIDWMTQDGDSGIMVLHSAPLNVGAELEKKLFGRVECAVLTSATLSTQGSFDYIRERVGLAEADELMVGSPFDYKQAALLLLPEDIPGPNQWGYQDAVSQVLVGLGEAMEGHTMALFTSHAALRATARAIRPSLEAHGIKVLAQGIDGSPRRLLQDFADDSRCVLLGTSSFWEGVDLAGGLLRALVVSRIPFHVPTEPIFAARSEQYEDAFHQYALPQAVLRLRQGIGRLIRGSSDRGAIVLLDRRLTSMSYGRAFLGSLPPCTEKRVPLSAVPSEAARWVRL